MSMLQNVLVMLDICDRAKINHDIPSNPECRLVCEQ